MVMETLQTMVNNLFDSYKKWLMANPQLVKDIEATMRCLSYLTAGRFNNSSLMSELIYSIPNLLVLFNDILMYSGKYVHLSMPQYRSKIKIWLTVLEYTDVLFEISARNLSGEKGRWIVIFLVQSLKSILRLLLVYNYKERVTKSLPIAPLNREKLADSCNSGIQIKEGFTLKRSKTTIRSIKSSTSIQSGSWTPPVCTDECLDSANEDTKKSLIIAETLYIVKPLLHLGCVPLTGQKRWQPWLVSLAIDIISLKMLQDNERIVSYTKEEREELYRRRIALLLYLLRSPFYDKYSRAKILAFLKVISSSVPFARFFAEPIQRYLPHWQDVYFYVWSC